jgi:ADP-heptose:LPS heptosyltransferase
MNIALVNFNDIKSTLENIHHIDKEIIDAHIDLFCSKEINDALLEIPELKNVNKQNIDHFFLQLQIKYKQYRYYAKINRYHIAIDTEGSFKSVFATYLLAGKTAGFRKRGFKGLLISKFYDEIIDYDPYENESSQIYRLLSKTFGFSKEFDID